MLEFCHPEKLYSVNKRSFSTHAFIIHVKVIKITCMHECKAETLPKSKEASEDVFLQAQHLMNFVILDVVSVHSIIITKLMKMNFLKMKRINV